MPLNLRLSLSRVPIIWIVHAVWVAQIAAAQMTFPQEQRYWNPDWKLERAGFGGAGRGMAGIRGITHLDGDILATAACA